METGKHHRTRSATSSNRCRSESIDTLHHLSGDGFMRPWLPSYANSHLCRTQKTSFQAVICILSRCITHDLHEEPLVETPAGRMMTRELEIASETVKLPTQNHQPVSRLRRIVGPLRGSDDQNCRESSDNDTMVSCLRYLPGLEECAS